MSNQLPRPEFNRINAEEKLNKYQMFFYDYGRYHYNLTNIIVHIFMVPLTLVTLLHLGRVGSNYFFGQESFNLGLLYIMASAPIFIYVDFFMGIFSCLAYLVMDNYLLDFHWGFGIMKSWQGALILFVLSFFIPVVSHKLFEKRKPAFTDNVIVALSAPLFIWLEIVYFFFGYRSKEIQEVYPYIVEDIRMYNNGESNLGSKNKTE